jgi:AcrR family transcriptional regulator
MDALIESARAELADRGVEATGIADLRRATGKSVGSLYHRFGSKEGLVAEVYADALGSYQEALAAELAGDPPARSAVPAVVRRHLFWHEGHREGARFLHENAGVGRREPGLSLVAALNERFFPPVGEWWDGRVAAGELRALPFDLAYVLWLGAAQEFCRLWLAGGTRVGMRTARRELAEGAWNSLRAKGS